MASGYGVLVYLSCFAQSFNEGWKSEYCRSSHRALFKSKHIFHYLYLQQPWTFLPRKQKAHLSMMLADFSF